MASLTLVVCTVWW